MKKTARIVLAALLCLLFVTACDGETPSVNPTAKPIVSGKILDSENVPVPEATVTLVCVDAVTGGEGATLPQQAMTKEDGTFSIEVEAGTYDLTVEKAGYETLKVEGLKVENGEPCHVETKPLKAVVKVSGISFDASKKDAFVGSKLDLTVTIAPDDASDKSVEWTSDNVAVATVDHEGKVECISTGTATITAKAKDGSGVSATCTVTVKDVEVPVTGLELNWKKVDLEVGESRELTATVSPENASNKRIIWSSSDDAIATVDESGKVMAMKEGVATITATTVDGGKTATCKVSVTEAKCTVAFNTDGGSAVASATIKLGGKVSKPADPTKKGYAFVKWTLDGKDFDFNAAITKDIELKAVWETIEPVVVVELKYEVRDGSKGKYAVVTGYKPTESTNASVVIPSEYFDSESGETVPVKEIGANAFDGFANLTNVTIANSVENIGGWAFFDCKNLKSIVVPDSVKNFGKGVFKQCTSLTSVTLPKSLGCIASDLFVDCISLTSITIPDSVKTIEGNAFSGCKGLSSIEIPDGVKEIAGYSFDGCRSLTGSITIPSSVTTIGNGVFDGCTGLTEIRCPSALETMAKENNTFKGIDSSIVTYY